MVEEKIYNWLKERRFENRILELNVSVATAQKAAEQIGCLAGAIAKTHALVIDGKQVIVVMSSDAQIDIQGFAIYHIDQKTHKSIREEVKDDSDQYPDGICPFGRDDNIDVILDMSLKRFDYVYLPGGNDHTLIKLKPGELNTVLDSNNWRMNGSTGWRDKNFVCKGQIVFTKDNRIILIDEVLEPGKRYLGRDFDGKDPNIIEVNQESVISVADEVCRGVIE